MPQLGVEFKPIFMRPWNLKGIKVMLEKALVNEGKEQRKLLKMTTATWKGSKPRFVSKRTISQISLAVNTFPTGSEEAVNKFIWLDEGTKKRWALMSQDWKSKTASGRLRSRGGGGRVLIAGRRAMQQRNIKARPGIEARDWTDKVAKIRRRRFASQMKRDFAKLARSLNGVGQMRTARF